MSLPKLTILFFITFTSYTAVAQVDSTLQPLQQLSKKYIEQIDNKVDKYTNRITNKTEKTLTKLAKWEAKVKTLLEKASPTTAQRLFAEGRPTFATLLTQYKQGEKLLIDTREQYNEYRDKLVTGFSYLNQQKENISSKLIQPIATTNKKLQTLQTEVQRQEAIEQFIKERKRELLNQTIAYIGNSKYLGKISKECIYYYATIKNYKELFSDGKKAEQTAIQLLQRIPAFNKFIEENSIAASLFRQPNNAVANIAGLQTRASVGALIQQQIAQGGPNAQEQIQQNLLAAQAELNKIRDKVIQAGQGGSDMETTLKHYNPEKAKLFKQRLELNTTFQFNKAQSYLPNTSDIGLSVGYKFTPKLIAGLGVAYKVGLGSINKIQLTNEALGVRSYVDWKLKHQFYLSTGFEINYNNGFKRIVDLQDKSIRQESALIGLSKKLAIKSKVSKGVKLQLYYDFLSNQHTPITPSFVWRVGYQLK